MKQEWHTEPWRANCIFCFPSHPVVIIKTSRLRGFNLLSETIKPPGRCGNANRFNVVFHSLPTVDINSLCSATFSLLLHKHMNIYYCGGKHSTVHNDCSWKNGNKHERLTGLGRGSSSGMVNQGLRNVKTTVIRRTAKMWEMCKRTSCWQKITKGSFRL